MTKLPDVGRVPADGLLPAQATNAGCTGLYPISTPRPSTDADGRFTFNGLDEGTINVVIHGDGENKDWTYKAAADVPLRSGETADVTIELIRGVEVEGKSSSRGRSDQSKRPRLESTVPTVLVAVPQRVPR